MGSRMLEEAPGAETRNACTTAETTDSGEHHDGGGGNRKHVGLRRQVSPPSA